jgi:hypothetical protein
MSLACSHSKRPLNTRGTRFALPMPRGGRNDKVRVLLLL